MDRVPDLSGASLGNA